VPSFFPLAAVLAALTASAPAPSVSAEPSGDPEPAEAPAQTVDPYAAEAPADITTLLTDTSRAYLQARARLVAHPGVASRALLDRLEAIPAPTKSQRKRLLDVLGELGSPEHLPMFAKELRRAVGATTNDADADKAAARWMPLLRSQGAAAGSVWSGLVADKDLPMSVRATALDALIDVTPRDDLAGLVVLVGRGSLALRGQLTRSLKRRVTANPDDRAVILQAVDQAAAEAAPDRMAALLQFRATLSGPGDAAFTTQLGELAENQDSPFVVRVAAVRGLSRQASPAAQAALGRVAKASLTAPQPSQSAEILAWLALTGLAPDGARPLAAEHALVDASSPRLAILGYTLAPLAADKSWLEASQDNPWPGVRQAALARVTAPCDKTTVKLMAARARPKSRAGDKDPAVARSHVQALGRCGDDGLPALIQLLKAGSVDIEQRTEAARQLAKHGGARGADAVADALSGNPSRRLARRLVSALRWVPAPTPKVARALCDAAAEGDNVAYGAVATLEALYKDPAAACAEAL